MQSTSPNPRKSKSINDNCHPPRGPGRYRFMGTAGPRARGIGLPISMGYFPDWRAGNTRPALGYLVDHSWAFIALAIALSALPAFSGERSSSVRAEFQREHPCPATGARRGSCPGYVIDHVLPLCAGGPDSIGNLQWQTITDARAKDAVERRMCAAIKNSQKS